MLLLTPPLHPAILVGMEDDGEEAVAHAAALGAIEMQLQSHTERRGRPLTVDIPEPHVDLYFNFPASVRADRGPYSRAHFVANLLRRESLGTLDSELAVVRTESARWRERERDGKHATSKMIVLHDHGFMESPDEARFVLDQPLRESAYIAQWLSEAESPEGSRACPLPSVLWLFDELEDAKFEPSPLFKRRPLCSPWRIPFFRARYHASGSDLDALAVSILNLCAVPHDAVARDGLSFGLFAQDIDSVKSVLDEVIPGVEPANIWMEPAPRW